MKAGGISIFIILTAGMFVVPMGFSHAQLSNETSTNQTNTISPNNQTSSEQTDNFGQQVSDFVHQAMAHFKQQRDDTINAIKDCREKIKNAAPENIDQVRADCKTTLKSIKEKYQDERKQFSGLFKEYREGVKVMMMEAKGMHVDKQDKEKALQHMNEMRAKKMPMVGDHMNNMQEKLVGKGLKTKNNTNCVNPPYGPKIC